MRLTAQITNLVVCITIIVFGVYGLIFEESQSGSILIMILGVLICLFNIKRINRRFPK